jgi:hypothetical protein
VIDGIVMKICQISLEIPYFLSCISFKLQHPTDANPSVLSMESLYAFMPLFKIIVVNLDYKDTKIFEDLKQEFDTRNDAEVLRIAMRKYHKISKNF